jgi:predicted ATPase
LRARSPPGARLPRRSGCRSPSWGRAIYIHPKRDVTRAYALTKLVESGETDALGRRHAAYYRDLLEAALNSSAGSDAAAAYAPEIDNIRAALTRRYAVWFGAESVPAGSLAND